MLLLFRGLEGRPHLIRTSMLHKTRHPFLVSRVVSKCQAYKPADLIFPESLLLMILLKDVSHLKIDTEREREGREWEWE